MTDHLYLAGGGCLVSEIYAQRCDMPCRRDLKMDWPLMILIALHIIAVSGTCQARRDVDIYLSS